MKRARHVRSTNPERVDLCVGRQQGDEVTVIDLRPNESGPGASQGHRSRESDMDDSNVTPPVNIDDVRQRVVDDLFDSLDRAARRWARQAQEHGANLTGTDDAWRSASEALVAAHTNYQALSAEIRRAVSKIVHEAAPEVVHDV